MDYKFWNRLHITTGIIIGVHYGAFFAYDWQNKDDLQKKFEKLNDETVDKLIDILSEANITKGSKYNIDFMINKDNLNLESLGRFHQIGKLIVLPGHFEIKEENEIDNLINRFKDANLKRYPKLKNINLSEYKDLFILTPEEIKFAILHEIYRSNLDYLYIDTIIIGISGFTSINLVSLFSKISNELKVVLAIIIAIIMFNVLHQMKPEAIETMATNKLIETNDLDLLEVGLKYLNKRIQLDQLLGKDVALLKLRFEKIKNTCESLRSRGFKQKQSNEPESTLKKDAKRLKERKMPGKSDAII